MKPTIEEQYIKEYNAVDDTFYLIFDVDNEMVAKAWTRKDAETIRDAFHVKTGGRSLQEQMVLHCAKLLARHIEYLDVEPEDGPMGTIELDEDTCSLLGLFKNDVGGLK